MANPFLEKKLTLIPDEFTGEILHFLDLLQYKINARKPVEPKIRRKIGGYEGQILLSRDYDEPFTVKGAH